jgi:hypothetical protein
MKTLKYFLLAVVAFNLAACGGKKDGSDDSNSVKLKVEAELGELGNYLSSTDEEVVVKLVENNEDGKDYITIVSSMAIQVKKAVASNYSFDFDVEVLDKDHIKITDLPSYEIDSNHNYDLDLSNVLSEGTVRAKMEGTVEKNEWNDEVQKNWDKIISQGVYISIKPKWSLAKYSEFNGSSSNNTNEEAIEEIEEVKESSFDLNNVLLPSQLKGKVEVISAEKSVSKYGYPSMEITFKLLSKVNTSSMLSEYGQMWIVGVGQNENGVDVKELLPSYREWRSGDSDGKEFKEFLESEPDETITLEFTGDKDSSNDVESDLEKVKKFKLKITN